MEDLRFSVLGTTEGRRGDTVLRLGGPQQQATIAALLLKPGRSSGVAELTDALWGDCPPPAAATTIRTYVWQFRKTLRTMPDAPEVLVSLGDGYRLQLPGAAVDARYAEELAGRADRARAGGNLRQARDLLNQALALWQGVPLAGLPGPFADRQRRRLVDLRLTLLEERLALDLAFGDSSCCISELTTLTTEHPLREKSYGLLMRALFQSSRGADALAVYHSARRLLIEELGVEPGPELTELHRRILVGDPELLPDAVPADRSSRTRAEVAVTAGGVAGGDDGPGPGGQPPCPCLCPAQRPPFFLHPFPSPAQLPPDTADFTGRRSELDALLTVLGDDGRSALAVAAVVGMGGVGKTALAVHAAHEAREHFPDGQLYADLRGGDEAGSSPGTILAGFLDALGVPSSALPADLDARSALFRSLLAKRRVLILLDNVRDSGQLRPLLPGAAGCAVLVTSRARPAGVTCVLQLELSVLRPSEAVELLGRTIGGERIGAEPRAALDLVSACGFLPLAIRIAATRLAARPSWTLAALTGRLADEQRRIDELRVGDLAVEAVFELGHRQLRGRQAEAFRLVATVDGTDVSSASAAALLGTTQAEAERLMESLVDAAMLESPSVGRYRFHDLLRFFGRRKAAAEGPVPATEARSRLLNFLLGAARAAFRHAVPGDPIGDALGPASAPGPEFADHPGAHHWAVRETDNAVALAAQVARTALAAEAVEPDHPRAACARRSQDDLRAAVDLLIALSPFGPDPRDPRPAATLQGLLDAAMRVGDRWAEGRCHFLRGSAALAASRLTDAALHTRRAVEVCREAGDTVILRQALNDLGLLTQYLGSPTEAAGHFDEAIALARQLGHRPAEAATAINAALAQVRAGRAAEVFAVCGDLSARSHDEPDDAGTAYALQVLRELGHPPVTPGPAEPATGMRRPAVPVRLDLRSDVGVFRAANALGAALAARGQASTALAVMEDLEERFAEIPELSRAVQAAAALIASHDGDSWLKTVDRLRGPVGAAHRRPAPAARTLVAEFDCTSGRLTAAQALAIALEVTAQPLDPYARTYVLASAATLAQWADDLPLAYRLVTAGLTGHRGPSADPGYQNLLSVHAESLAMRGRYGELLEACHSWGILTRPAVRPSASASDNAHLVAQAVIALTETGRTVEARQLADSVALDGPRGSWEWNELLYARGLLYLAEGAPAAALDDLLECGRRQGERHVISPIVTPWRSAAADCQLLLGRPREAVVLAAEELEAARHWGTPRCIGRAMRAWGAATGGRVGLATVEQSVDLLGTVDTTPELVSALITHSSMLVEASRYDAARQALREAARHAERIDAIRLRTVISDLLTSAGAGPSRPSTP
ncbi:NB-ARC domain-containing protein [Streptomyces avidinii]|uniref:AfsR/SARP family transcriptional regulator n=1 Tax=Streptomyces avidinii TaxID=1895 RepID=UPI003868AB99|nr:NB-ARC domain-containing protein [Streptomyces avidinii]